jgi:hypothetical protein
MKPYTIKLGKSDGRECLLCGSPLSSGEAAIKLSLTLSLISLLSITTTKNEEVHTSCARSFSKEIESLLGRKK